MADIIRGTNIADPIVPYTTADNIPTHYAQYGKGGFRTVETIEERNAIPFERKEAGMLVYVINDDSNIHTYQWFPVDGDPDKEWKRSKMGGGDSIPIYDSEKLNELGPAADEDYIFVRSESDLEGQVTENTYTTTKNGSYVDILFGAIRELQSEVARLRNAFNYGIYSYSGTDTAMSRVQGVYTGDVEDEPLWAIEEDGLSLQEDLLENISDFRPQANIEYTTEERLPHFVDNAGIYTTWRDETLDLINGVDDSKLFLYITASSPEITLLLNDKEDVGLELPIDLSSILNDFSHPEWYNILVVISRKQKVEDEDENITYFGSNFIWISASNSVTSNTIAEGYLNLDNRSLTNSLVTRENRYTINSIGFKEGLTLSKAIVYSKYQDFSQEVVPSKPTDSKFSYKAAHITIRSVSTYEVLSTIKSQLPENELIFVEDTKKLYIKNNYKLVAISGAGNEQQPPGDDTMTAEEILQALADKGIIVYDPETATYTGLQPLEGITLINEETGKQFELNVDAYGELIIKEVLENEITLASRLGGLANFPPENDLNNWDSWRGFVGQLRIKENPDKVKKLDGDAKLYSDRIKIGSFYAPVINQTNPELSQVTFGCSHGFIELENTSDADFQLDGCYLHYSRQVGANEVYTSHLALSGKVPANGTYLVRCKQYSDLDDPNTFIKVKTYDIEWYEKDITVSNISSNGKEEIKNESSRELVDLSHNGIVNGDPHGLALTYGRNFGSESFTYNCKVWVVNTADKTKEKAPALWWSKFIDAVYYNGTFTDSSTNAYWAATNNRMASCVYGVDDKNEAPEAKIFIDAIYKNTFELDPAKQAYQALNIYDSSRARHQNVADYQYILLTNEYISFPKTDEVYPVTKFTPRASFEKRNVLTDKNKLDPNKPNCVTCSFGIDPYKTRTFNWVSSGYFDEYVWVRLKDNENTSWTRFSSYTKKAQGTTASQSSNYPRRREFDAEINNIVYNRIYGYFPGDENCTYTSHKCILDLVWQSVESKTTYEYVVGRSLANGEPDPEHTSKIMTFTLYPEDYPLRIYQTTDQQGFHWIEYQSWGAAANHINNRINDECSTSEIIPVLMNTGDMTQSGCRVNEWVDYYNAGTRLFDHLEQVNCVGNNDLCGTVVTELGTGDDIGKSNSFYFHVFYCYEVDTTEGMVPIVRGKYVPSLYHIDFKNFRLVVVNSEITYENCKSWYKMVIKSDGSLVEENMFNEDNKEIFNQNIASKVYQVINIYTGWTIDGTNIPSYYNNFTSIYTMIYHMLKGSSLGDRKCIVACHEMPFTVITAENLYKTKIDATRSANGNSLVGSHLNQINTDDKIATHWFSRLLEDAGVKLCIGGHKHTYAQTWPVRENYYYKVRSVDGDNVTYSENWTSSLTKPMTMREDLSEERFNGEYTVKWEIKKEDNGGNTSGAGVLYSVTDTSGQVWIPGNECPDTIHLSKFPIIESNSISMGGETGSILPGTIKSDTNYGVTYFMCQATGFKLMSNKELPSPKQVFSRYFPQSTYEYKDETDPTKITKSSASKEQRRPMYATIDLKKEEGSYKILGKLIRLNNIQSGPTKLFNQLVHGTSNISAQYLYDNPAGEWAYGSWDSTERNIINITQ